MDGAYKPFKLNNKERPFELSVSEITEAGNVVAMASSGTQLALAMSGDKVVLLDTVSAVMLKRYDVPSVTAIAFSPAGQCYVISNNRLAEMEMETGTLRIIPTPGLTLGYVPEGTDNHNGAGVQQSLTVDASGVIGILDKGTDQQVKFYSPKGVLQYTAGR